MPAGGTLLCWTEQPAEPSCVPYAFDPTHGAFGPLTTQPPLRSTAQVGDVLAQVPTGSDRAAPVWLAGTDPVTRQPTTAVSTDQGQSWSRRALPDLPACGSAACEPAELVSGDGRTFYAVARPVATERFVYRSIDGGDWQRMVGMAPTARADRPGTGSWSYVTADGSLVFCDLARSDRFDGAPGEVDSCRFSIGPAGGGKFQPVELDGLPGTVIPVRRALDGWYYTHSYGDQVLYGSTDGRSWNAISTPRR